MRPGTFDLDLYRGDTFAWTFRLWNDLAKTDATDLTGVTPKAEIREKSGSTTIMTMVCVVTLPNVISVELPETQWAEWSEKKSGAWDLQLTYGTGEIITVVAGRVTITSDVTESVTV